MKSLLIKELRLAASPLTYLFLAFSLMTLIPGYPILVGAFFVCLGIFHSFQSGREANDTLYTVLLPVEKGDAVRSKYIFVCFFQLIALAAMAALTVLRRTVLRDGSAYVNNVLMDANPVFLAWATVIFTLFNGVFLGLFFKTAYKYGKPFVAFIIVAFAVVMAAETLCHVPGLAFLNGNNNMPVQLGILAAALILYAAVTALSCRRARADFEKIDL